MKVRSLTCFLKSIWPLPNDQLEQCAEFIAAARPALEAEGYEVQTARLSTPSFSTALQKLGLQGMIELATALETAAQDDIQYLALGPALPDHLDSYEAIPEVIAATQRIFMSGLMTTPEGVSLPAVRACAGVIQDVAGLSSDGFANLRFAALANTPPGAPFFPASYADGNSLGFALALEAADLAVQAFSAAASLGEARAHLITAIEEHAVRLTKTCQALAQKFAFNFNGLDFTLAPFPQEDRSIGTALESLGLPALGEHGSLTAAAFLADTLDRARYPRAGFNGLMLPVLEDVILARRVAEGLLGIKDLLLFASVCGTGLDTLPLPGETTLDQLYALLLDLAALAQRLDKPLTARLMPIPGKTSGDPTDFDFPFFANSRVLELYSQPLRGILTGKGTLPLGPRRQQLV